MKKIIVIIGLITSLMATGCTKQEAPKEEVTTIVYCDSCSEESNGVTKFCSNCGEEAKWLAEKPEIKTEGVQEEEKTEDIKEDSKLNESTSKDTTSNKEYEICSFCGEKFDKGKGINGYCSEECNIDAGNTKADSYFEITCFECDKQISEQRYLDWDGYCEECWEIYFTH